MKLALRMGRTLDELGAALSAREFLLWQEFDRISPIGDERTDYNLASLASVVAATRGAKGKLADFMLAWDGSGGGEGGAVEDDAGLKAAIMSLVPA